MSDLQKAAVAGAETTTEEVSLLDQIVQEGRMARDPVAKERGKNLVKEFVTQVLEGSMTVSKDAEAMINARIAQIDHLVSIQLNEVLHHPDFQKLEGTWRGLKYLMDQSETSDKLKIKIMNTSKKDLLRDLQRAPGGPHSGMRGGLRTQRINPFVRWVQVVPLRKTWFRSFSRPAKDGMNSNNLSQSRNGVGQGSNSATAEARRVSLRRLGMASVRAADRALDCYDTISHITDIMS